MRVEFTGFVKQSYKLCKDILVEFSKFFFPPPAEIMSENIYWTLTAPLKADIPMMMGKVSFVIRFTETV